MSSLSLTSSTSQVDHKKIATDLLTKIETNKKTMILMGINHVKKLLETRIRETKSIEAKIEIPFSALLSNDIDIRYPCWKEVCSAFTNKEVGVIMEIEQRNETYLVYTVIS
jgi:hypothetical protein